MQKTFPDKSVFWGDLEHVFDPVRAEAIGVDMDRIIVSQPSSAEEGLESALMLAKAGVLSLAVYDSIAAVAAMAETEASMADSQMGVAPRLVNKFLRKWLSSTSPRDGYLSPTLLCTNQKREKIGGFRPMETTPGGRGLGFFASVELEISHGDKISLKEDDDSGEPILIGHDVNFNVIKNNTFPLGKRGKFILCTRPYQLDREYTINAHDVDWPHSLLSYATYYGVVEKDGNTYKYKGKKLGVGKLQAQISVFNDASVSSLIYDEVIKASRLAHGINEEKDVEKKKKRIMLRKGK